MTGPLRDSDNRPFVKTRLKYDITVEMAEHIANDPPDAEEVLTKNVSAVIDDVIKNVKEQIGDVILASQNFSHPNRTTIIDTEVEPHKPNNLVPEGKVHITWTYVVEGTGIGEAAETSATLTALNDMYAVLIEGDNTPIESNTAIRNFDSGPLEVDRVRVTTE